MKSTDDLLERESAHAGLGPFLMHAAPWAATPPELGLHQQRLSDRLRLPAVLGASSAHKFQINEQMSPVRAALDPSHLCAS